VTQSAGTDTSATGGGVAAEVEASAGAATQ
jgi:hypothetical protein